MTMQTELTAQERAAIITWKLAFGAQLTTREIAEMMGLTHCGAWRLMMRLSRVLAIFCNDEGEWCKMERCEMEEITVEMN